jgi:glycosyltransferase involved in cell wall biosynthesis
LAARVKIELIVGLLREGGHEVEVISQGAVDKRQFRLHPAFMETEPFDTQVPVYYVSAFPIRIVRGIWEGMCAKRLFLARHRERPFDLVILYNLKRAQIQCARLAMRRLRIPVVLEYEDDGFADFVGRTGQGLKAVLHRRRISRIFRCISGAIAPSPYLLSQCPESLPRMLVRSIIGEEIVRNCASSAAKQNWVVFSGTLEGAQGIEQSIRAWRMLRPRGWELHIAGKGPLAAMVIAASQEDASIKYHGLLNRQENADLLCQARIGLNTQDVTSRPGNTFPFKIVEYLAAGNRVVTTPRGPLEEELEEGVTYIPDNAPETIAGSLRQLIDGTWDNGSADMAAARLYGHSALASKLNELINTVATAYRGNRHASGSEWLKRCT